MFFGYPFLMEDSGQIRRQQSIFFIELDKIKPNPQQPRKEFDEIKLAELAESIRQYGVLQPLVVVRREGTTPTGIATEYELIAGERRLRASRLAGLRDIPVIIREEPAEKIKLELALVENLQREDLNALDRAEAFQKLSEEFAITHKAIGEKIGRSREYVANSIRLLSLPSEAQQALREGRISEGHARPLLMLTARPEEQKTLFDDILYKNLSVREAERVSRKIISNRPRSEAAADIELKDLEEKLANALGTRVSIEKKGEGGRISIDFFSAQELQNLLSKLGESEISLENKLLPPEEMAQVEKISDTPAVLPPVLPAEPSEASHASPAELDEFTI